VDIRGRGCSAYREGHPTDQWFQNMASFLFFVGMCDGGGGGAFTTHVRSVSRRQQSITVDFFVSWARGLAR